ncbi:MAG: shikimate dehydrogenase [Flavobacteriales bacterium]|nr:shikimate dehydrogenase [Flavobacteriales bacterium]
MKTFGLVGKSLSHSFSSQYFSEKFYKENITNCQYLNFEIDDISNIKKLISENDILGLNITIPYKTSIIPYLDGVSDESEKINAVNTVKIVNGKLYGFNTDVIGFKKSISPILDNRKTALVLGNGGSSKSVQYVLKNLDISFKVVSRKTKLDYQHVDKEIMETTDVIINCTPLGMYPETESYPKIPYEFLNSKHLLFDLVYNPKQSKFLTFGIAKNCIVKNGLEMLHIQAEESWNIWNNNVV